MNVIISKKGSDRNESHRYWIWLRDFVNKGIAHEYDILQYPELVILRIINEDGHTIRKKVTEYRDAKELTDKSPKEYGFVRINISQLKEDHFKRSRLISRKDSFSLFNPLKISASLCLFAFSLYHFERKCLESKYWINMIAKTTYNAIMLFLSVAGVVGMLYIAHRQGIIKLF
jgi:hypothetical protein